MHHGVWLEGADGGADGLSVAQVANRKRHAGSHRLAMAALDVVEDADFMSSLQQLADGDAADVAGSACYENLHFS